MNSELYSIDGTIERQELGYHYSSHINYPSQHSLVSCSSLKCCLSPKISLTAEQLGVCLSPWCFQTPRRNLGVMRFPGKVTTAQKGKAIVGRLLLRSRDHSRLLARKVARCIPASSPTISNWSPSSRSSFPANTRLLSA